MPHDSLFTAAVLKPVLAFPLRRSAWRGPLLTLTLVFLALFLIFPPLALLIEAGYALQVARRMFQGSPPELVETVNWEQILMDGLYYWVIVFLFSLPALVVALVGGLGSLFISGAFGPKGMIAYLQYLTDHFWPVYAFFALVLLLVIVALIFATVAAFYMLEQGSFAAAFHARAWWPVLRANRGGFFQAEVFLIVFGLTMLLAQTVFAIPTLVTCIGPVIVLGLAEFYQRLVLTAVYAHEYRNGRERLKE